MARRLDKDDFLLKEDGIRQGIREVDNFLENLKLSSDELLEVFFTILSDQWQESLKDKRKKQYLH
ncbi:hypothetical protein N9A72_00635 [bacterium]|nr:hypothetical protein [bacterium]